MRSSGRSFPSNSVHYFVSYYDYYQPEAYIPQRDIYIEKDASINDEIDRLRLATTSALVSRSDVIVVASVSSIYGLGSPDDYREMMVALKRGETIDRDCLLMKLVDIQYDRNDVSFERGKFRVRGDCVEIWPSYEEYALRVELWGDEIDQLSLINPTSGETIATQDQLFVYPAKHFVMPEARIAQAVALIKQELDEQLERFRLEGKLLEAQRLSGAHAVRHGDAAGDWGVSGYRELQPSVVGTRCGRAPGHAVRLLPRRFPAVCRRIARHHAADPCDVCRRPESQTDAGRTRIPAAQCPGQPTAAV